MLQPSSPKDNSNSWFAIVNPVAGSGEGVSDLPTISKQLRDNGIIPTYVFTEHRYHAIELAVDAVSQGFRKIIVIGGDGTIHEVVNGLYIQKTVKPQEVLVAVIAVGTGNDWIRMFGIPRKYSEAIKAIVAGYSFLQDVGNISYNKASYNQSRYMANVAGVGFDAHVNRYYNHLKESGYKNRWLYVFSALKAVLGYSSTKVKVFIDGNAIVDGVVFSATIGIGKYNGGGMIQMPSAVADDGLFDVTVIRNVSKIAVLCRFRSLFNGNIYNNSMIDHYRGRKIRIESDPKIAVEVDGEALGYSPFEFDMIDRGVRVIVTEKFLKSI